MERPKGRITLRMEPGHVERMDDFLERSKDFDSRSQLCRVALQNYINIMERKSDEVLVTLPEFYLDLIDKLVEKGCFPSRDAVLAQCLIDYFTEEKINQISKAHKAGKKFIDEVPTITVNDKKEIIPR